MALQLVRGGQHLDIPSLTEIRAAAAEAEREAVRGVKYGRMPLLSGTPSNSALTMGGDTSPDVIGPDQGYAWIVRHLWVTGLTSGATPDVVNLVVNNQAWWQFNGNNFAYTFGPGELVLQPGEAWAIVSTGTIAATGKITFGGAFWSAPAEMIAKLAAG